jgi:hypothetical protein
MSMLSALATDRLPATKPDECDVQRESSLALLALAAEANEAQQIKHVEAQILQSASLKANEDGRAAMIVRDFWGIAAAASASAIAPRKCPSPTTPPPVQTPSPRAPVQTPTKKRKAEDAAATTSGAKACRWKNTVLFQPAPQPQRPALPAPRPAPAAAGSQKKAVPFSWKPTRPLPAPAGRAPAALQKRAAPCNWKPMQPLVPGKAQPPPAVVSPRSAPTSPRSDCELV